MARGATRLDTGPGEEELARLERRCFARPWRGEDYAQLRKNPGGGAWILRGEAEQPLAFLCFQRAADELEIHRIAVVPRRRRAGWGRKLLAELLAHAAREGVAQVFLEVRAGNAAARGLYESAGFRRAALRKGYFRDPPEDALVFRCAPGSAQGS